jgi:tetratricopeptide (TPR) repeat protein
MSFISRLFFKNTDGFLKKGDSLFSDQRFFEARRFYEDGLHFYLGKDCGKETDSTAALFRSKIAQANRELAGVNIAEAEHAIGRGDVSKAVEHLELALSLTDDVVLRAASEKLLTTLVDHPTEAAKSDLFSSPIIGCGACDSTEQDMLPATSGEETGLSRQDYYDLLIRQLPAGMYARYADLGDNFINLYLAASHDKHEKALNLLEEWYKGSDEDIYWYEKGMILHRLGNVGESEVCFRTASRCNAVNPLPRLGLALLLCEGQRLDEAAEQLDAMIAEDMIVEQALMLRGDVSMLAGDVEGAIERYGMLLSTPHTRPAAEKLYELLIRSGRKQEAAVVHKKYLGGCRH